MGSQEGPIESTEDAAIANEQPIARKTKVDTLANGDKAADESLVCASVDNAITSPIRKHEVQAGNGRILDEQIGTVVAKDPVMLEEVVRDAELGSNTSQKEIQIFEGKDSNEDIVEDFGEQAADSTSIGMEQQDTHEVEQVEEDCVREPTAITDIDRVIAEDSSEQAHVQEGIEEEKPHKSSLLVDDKVDGVDNTGVEEAAGLNEENLQQEFSSREDRADEEVKNNDSAGELIMDKSDEPTITSIDEVQREPIVQELALPGQDENATTLNEKPVGGVVDDFVAPIAPADGIEKSNGIDEPDVSGTPSTVVKEEVTSASTEFEGIPKDKVATHVEVEKNSNEVSDSLPAQGEIMEEAVKGEDCEVDDSTKVTGTPTKEWESKGVVDVLETPLTLVKDPTSENDVDEAIPFEEPTHVVGNNSSRSLPMQDEVVEEAPTAALVNNVSRTPVEEEPIVGGAEEDVAPKVEDCDVESRTDVQGADETPTSPVEVEESTDVGHGSNVPSIVAKEEVIPASTQFEGEPELAKSIDVGVSTEDSVNSTEAPLPLEEHAEDVKNSSSQVSDSLPTQNEIVEEVPTGAIVTTDENVSQVDDEPIGGREEEFVALKADDSTKHIEGVDEEPVEAHESKEVADESNVVKDELTEVHTEDELVEVNTEDNVKSREAPLPLEEPTHVVRIDSNEAAVSPTPVEEEPIVGGEEEDAALKVEDCDVESRKDVQGADETPTSPVEVEESTDVVETPPIVAKEEVVPASSQFEGEPELVGVDVSTEDSVESTEAPVPLEEHADDVKNNSSQVSDSLPTQDRIVEEVPTGTAEDVSSTPVDEEPIGGREEEFGALKADDCGVESTKPIERVEEEPVEVQESKDVADESTVVKDEPTEVNTEDGLVEGNTEDDVKSREAPLPLEEPVENDRNEIFGTLPMQVEKDATVPLVEDVIQEAEPVTGGEKEPLALHEIDESTKLAGGVDEAEQPKDVVDESTMGEAEVAPTLEDDVGSREATLPTQVAENNSNEGSHSLPAHDEIVEEAPTFTSVEDVSSPAQEEEPTVGPKEKSVKVEDSEVEESAQGVETPVEVEESTDVVDGFDVVDEKVIPASNQGEPDVEFREATLASEDPAQPTHVETVEEAPTTADAAVDEARPATTEINEVVDESNTNETPLVEEEESKEVIESNASETPLVEEQSTEVVDESNANKTPLVEKEPKEVVDESNANETPLVKEQFKEVVDESNIANETPPVEEQSEEVVDEPNANETPLVEEQSEEVVDESNANETPLVEEQSEEVVHESNANETPLRFKEQSEEVVDESNGNETPLVEEQSEEVVHESNANETPLRFEEQSEEVVDESNANETPLVEEQSEEVVDESNIANETPLVEGESKEVVDKSNVIEAPSTVAEEEVSPAYTQFEEEPEVPEVAQDHTESKGEGEVKEDVTSTEEEGPVCGGEEESVASNSRDFEVDESTKHGQGVLEALPAATDVEESKDVVDEVNLLETPSTVVEEEVTPTSTESEGGPEEVAKFVEVTTEPLALEEPTQDSSALAADDEIVEEVPTTLITNAEEEPIVGGEEESLAPKVEDSNADDESRKHTAEGVEETLPTSNEVDDSKDLVDDRETSSTVVEEATSTPVKVEPVDGGEEESRALKVENSDVDESTKHTERVDETPTEVEAGDEVPLAPSDEAPLTPLPVPAAASLQDAPPTLVEEELIDHVGGGEEQAADNDVDQQVENAQEVDGESSKNVVDLVDAPSTRVEDEVTPTSAKHEGEPLAPESVGEAEVNEQDVVESREMPMEVSAGNNSIEEPSALSVVEEAPVTSTLVEEELADSVVEPIAATEADEAPSTPAELEMVDEAPSTPVELEMVDKLEAPSTTVGDEVTPTSHEEPVAPDSEDAIESLEEEPAQIIENRSSEEPSVLPRHEEVVEEAPAADAPLASANDISPTQVEQNSVAGEHEVPKAEDEELAVGGEEEPIAAIEADEAPAELEETRDSDLEAPSTTLKEAPTAPEADDVMEDARESLEEEPTQVVENSSSEEPSVLPRHEEVVEEAPATTDAPLASLNDISPTQVEPNIVAGEDEVAKAEDDLPPQMATRNGAPQHEDAGDLSEEETEPKEASMDGGSTNGGLVASTLRSIVTTTMNLVKTTKPSKKKRMKLKKALKQS